MPVGLPLVVGVAMGLGLFLLLIGVAGRPDPSAPRCRRCRADARPVAWREPPLCGCGADLSRPRSVRVGRRRRAWILVLAAVALFVGLGTARFVAWLRIEGRHWVEVLPASIQGRVARESSDAVLLEALGVSISQGLSPAAARAFLESATSEVEPGKPSPLGASGDLVAMAAGAMRFDPESDQDLASRVIVVVLGDALPAVVLDGEARGATLVWDAPLDWATEVQIREASDAVGPLGTLRLVGDRPPVTIGPDDWTCVQLADLVLRPEGPVRPVQGPIQLAIEIRVARIPANFLPLDAAFGLPESEWPWIGSSYGGTVKPTTTAPPRGVAHTSSIFYRRSVALAPVAANEATAPSLEAFVLCGTVAVGAALSLLYAWALVRGRVCLAPPRCMRCASLLRGLDDRPPAICSECGMACTPRNVRWIAGQRSVASLLVTVPVVLFGGTFAAFLLAWLVVRPAMATWTARQVGATGELVHRLAGQVRDLDERSGRAQQALERIFFGFERPREEAADALREEVLAIAERVAADPRGRDADCWRWSLPRYVERLVDLERLDRVQADELHRKLVGPVELSLPTHVAVGEAWSIEGGVQGGYRFLSRLQVTHEDGRVDERWCRHGQDTVTVPASAAPERMTVDVEMRALPVASFAASPSWGKEPESDEELAALFAGAIGSRTARFVVDAVTASDARPALTVDPAFDPFADQGNTVRMQVVESPGAIVVWLAPLGTRGAMLSGEWTVEADGVSVRLGRSPLGNSFHAVTPWKAVPTSVVLRYRPTDPPLLPDVRAWPNSPLRSPLRVKPFAARWGAARDLRLDRDGEPVPSYGLLLHHFREHEEGDRKATNNGPGMSQAR